MTLSEMEMRNFRNDGFLIFRRMAEPAITERMQAVTHEHLRAEIAPIEYEAEVGYPGAPASLDAPGGRTARRLRGAYRRHDCFREWAEDRRVIARLIRIFGEQVCLTLAHHNCVMTKHPDFGTATGWHRDIRYWSFARKELVTVWLALGEENEANGALKVIPGSHRLDIKQAQMDDLDFLRPDVPENQPLFAQGKMLELQAGDVVFFHSGLFHAAGRNASRAVKTSVVFAYHGASNKPVEGTRSAAAGSVLLEG